MDPPYCDNPLGRVVEQMLDAGAASKALDKPPDADSARAVAIDLAAVIAVSAVGPVIVAVAELVRLVLVAAAGGPGHWSPPPGRAPTPGRLPALCVLSS